MMSLWRGSRLNFFSSELGELRTKERERAGGKQVNRFEMFQWDWRRGR